MAIKFIPPNQSGKDILDELDKIVEALQKKPDPILENNKKFLRSFLKGMFLAGKKQAPRTSLPIQPLRSFSIPEKKLKIRPQQALPPPPPPSPDSSSQQAFKKQNNTLVPKKQEPQMMDKDWQLYNKIAPKVQKSPEKQDEIIKEAAKNMGINISQPYIDKIRYYLERNMKKYDVLTPLIEEPRIKAIEVRPTGNIYVNYGDQSLPVSMNFDPKWSLVKFQKSLLNKFNKNIEKESQISIQTPEFNITGIYSDESPTLKIEKLKQ